VFLYELTTTVQKLPGVGPAVARDLHSLGIACVRDLLLHLPRTYEDRRTHRPLVRSGSGEPPDLGEGGERTVNTTAEVIAHDFVGPPGRRTLKVYVRDESGHGALTCFGRNFLADKLPPGMRIRLYGKFRYRYGELQAGTFEFEPEERPPRAFGAFLAIYPLSGNLTQGKLRSLVDRALTEGGRHVADEIPDSVRERYRLACTAHALAGVHRPESLEMAEQARRALAFSELFLLQMSIVRTALRRRAGTGRAKRLPRERRDRLASSFPFSLTRDQQRVLEEIHEDLESARAMSRLIQGDIGSGKTLVAFLASIPVWETGGQTVFMAPTELLARQHAENAARLLEPVGMQVGLLTGSMGRAERETLRAAVEHGEVDFLVGTHALFTPDLGFRRLDLAIIDEQQRFGVDQRARLVEKSTTANLLVLTATPIPRTLALTLFGHMDVSTIHTMPPGRKPVRTHLAREGNEEKVYRRVRQELEAGRQAYFVYPAIEHGTDSDLKSAEEMYERIRGRLFSEARVGLIHSRRPEDEKRATMAAFVAGELDILVATSVVEVGVDVPNATCMVVEHAERFGLSALHQLRGRVGRSDLQSYCFLIYSAELTEAGKARMRVMHQEHDGFRIAEEDLKIRGPGDLAGNAQSGYLRFAAADLSRDIELMQRARSEATRILEADPELTREEHHQTARALDAYEAAIDAGREGAV